MKRFTAILGALVCLTFIALPASAAERQVDPYKVEQDGGGFGFPTLVYKYDRDGVQVGFKIQANFRPDEGAMVILRDEGAPNVFQEFQFHTVVQDETTEWFNSIAEESWFKDDIKVGNITEPGNYNVTLGFYETTGLGSEAGLVIADFALNLADFDFYESVCNFGRNRVAIEYSVFSIAPLPSAVDEVRVEYGGRSYTFSDVPIQGGGDKSGWIRLPLTFHSRLYDRLLGGKYLTTTMTINGETVMREKGMLYPASSHARYTCERG